MIEYYINRKSAPYFDALFYVRLPDAHKRRTALCPFSFFIYAILFSLNRLSNRKIWLRDFCYHNFQTYLEMLAGTTYLLLSYQSCL